MFKKHSKNKHKEQEYNLPMVNYIVKVIFNADEYFNITPSDIIQELSDEERTRFNQCSFERIKRTKDGQVEISCRVFNNKDET